MPKRIQRKRAKGFKLPPGSIYVGRPSKWGNPFNWQDILAADEEIGKKYAVEDFKNWLAGQWPEIEPERRKIILDDLDALRGKDLACWCRPHERCHADVLLELANRSAADDQR